MAWLRWLLLESAPALAGVLFVVLFVLLVYWRRGGSAKPLLVGAVVGVILLIVQALVVTPREHADKIMRRIERGVIASRANAVAAELSPAFAIESPHWNRADFLDVVRAYMRRIDVRSLTRRFFQISERTPDSFRLTVSYLAEINARDAGGVVLTRWRIDFERRGGKWQIRRIVPIEFNHRVIKGWSALRALR